MPAFARLQETGRLGPLATSNPAESPVAWSSLATGCNPGQHGIFDFIHRDAATYIPRLSVLREAGKHPGRRGDGRFTSPRARPGFWRITSDAGIPTTVVRWPVTFPAERVTGNFLAGLGVPDVTGRLGKYTFYTTAPAEPDDEKVVRVSWRDGTIVTALHGPPVRRLLGTRPLSVELKVVRAADGVTLSIASQQQTLRPGQWSRWFTLQFRWGPVRVCAAIVKFYLAQIDPELRLFATPLQIHPEDQVWPLTCPAAYGRELAEAIGPHYTLGLPEDTHAVTDGRYDLDAFLHQCAEIAAERRAMFEHELNRFTDGALAFVFDAGDRLQHMFWSIDDPKSPTYDNRRAQKYREVIPELYRDMDSILATVMQTVDDDTAVFVVSDHGFGSFYRAVHLNRWLIDNGYMKLKDGSEGRSLLADVDWSQTRAYALGFTSLYLNLAGRESKGIVPSGVQSDQLLRRIAGGLSGAGDPATGEKMIRSVYSASEIYEGAQAAHGPDLVVGYEPGYRASWQTALGAAPTHLAVDNDKLWSADHLVDPSAVPGVLATNVAIDADAASGVDLAPTILACLDLRIPPYMDGRSWLNGEANARSTRGPSACQNELEPVCSGALPSTSDGLDETQRAQLEQHLSDLGYL